MRRHPWAFATFFLLLVAILYGTSFLHSYTTCEEQQKKAYQAASNKDPSERSTLIRISDAVLCEGNVIYKNESFIGAVATVAIALFTLALWLATKDLWQASRDQLAAAEKSSARELRAYLGVLHGRIVMEEGKISAAIEVYNLGRTPATKVRQYIKMWRWREAGDEFVSEKMLGEPRPQTYVLPPGGRWTVVCPLDDGEEPFKALPRETKPSVIVYGKVTYRDQFQPETGDGSEDRKLVFAYRCGARKNDGSGHWHPEVLNHGFDAT